MKTEEDILRSAVERFGVKSQTIKAIEEMAELIQVLSKTLNEHGENLELVAHICEEIADVEIMLAQLNFIYDPTEIEKHFQTKLERLERKIRKLAERNHS